MRVLLLLLACALIALAAPPPWPNVDHDGSRTRFTPNGPAVTSPWTVNTNYSFISSLGPAVDSIGITYVVGDNGDGCEVVAFDPVSGALHVVSTCPDGAALSLYTSVVITNNAIGDVILFPLAVGSEWTMVAITTSGKSLWSAQINAPVATSQVSADGSQVFLLTDLDGTAVVMALDTTTGALNWNTSVAPYPAGYQDSAQLFADNEGAIYPVVQRGRDFKVWNVTVARLSATSGALLWKTSFLNSLPTPLVYSPVISALVVANGGNVVAYSTKTAKQLWSAPLPLDSCLGVLMSDPVSGNLYFTCQDSTMLALNSSGGLNWTYVIRSAPGGLGYLSMAVRSPASDTDAGAVVYNGQANLNNLSVPFAALSATGSLLWSKAFSVAYPTIYLVGPNVCVYYSTGATSSPVVSISCWPGSFSL